MINCGADVDTATIDVPTELIADATPIECETVRQGKPEDFRTATELPPPPLPPVDRTPPGTKITHRPARLLLTAAARPRRVAFRFSSNEPGSSFRCKLDAKPYRACTSPRAYTVGRGHHAVRIYAIDAAGNRDPSPALFRFQVRRR